jgi:MFS family permease
VSRLHAATSSTFRSLRSRNYRLFFFGQLVSMIGTWMQTVALGWLVYSITGSPTQIGLITAVQFVPTLVASMPGGLIADRFDKRKVLVWTQTAFALQAALLAGLALAGLATLPVLYALALVQGAITTVDNPTRQAFVTEMVGRGDLANAVALNSAMFNMARILGPAIGGLLIEAVGTTTCFVLNAVSFLAVIAGLLAMRSADLQRSAPAPRAPRQLRDGLRYIWEEPTLRLVLCMVALIGTFAMNFQVVLPVVAKQVFGGTAGTYGLLSAFIGIGSLLGALMAASRARPTIRLLAISSLAFGVTMLADAVAATLALEMAALVLTGMASITFMASANATLQLTSRPEMRGRVMAVYMLLFLGSTPIGGPLVGWISAQWGARWSLAVGGVACIGAAALTVPRLRRARRARLAREAGESVEADGDDRDTRLGIGQPATV